MSGEIGFENGYPSVAHRLARNRLAKSHLFKDLPPAEIDRIAGLFEQMDLTAGERLFREGDPGDSFFFVLAGRVIVTRRHGDEEELISTLTAGDFFGEGAILFGNPRRASVTAIEETAVLRMRREDFTDEHGQTFARYVLPMQHWAPVAPEERVAHPAPLRYALSKAVDETISVTRLASRLPERM